jgi:ABC-type multidrug transport system, ATPase component
MDTVIEMKGITKAYGGKPALAGINCTVQKKEIFGLLGPSGAGKTTMINILTGQISYDSGSSKLFDVDTNHLSNEMYRKIGLVLDNTGLYERLSCKANLELFADIYKLQKSRVTQVLEAVELGDSGKKAVFQLSKGMKQRLVLARAILNEPEMLFLDEPTSDLDPATSNRIHSLILSLKEKGSTIFLTTHNMEEAYKLCDSVALLNDGTIVEYGNPEEICYKYNTENEIRITLFDGSVYSFANDGSRAAEIASVLASGKAKSIHSSEPNLETVFLKLTGKRFVQQ